MYILHQIINHVFPTQFYNYNRLVLIKIMDNQTNSEIDEMRNEIMYYKNKMDKLYDKIEVLSSKCSDGSETTSSFLTSSTCSTQSTGSYVFTSTNGIPDSIIFNDNDITFNENVIQNSDIVIVNKNLEQSNYIIDSITFKLLDGKKAKIKYSDISGMTFHKLFYILKKYFKTSKTVDKLVHSGRIIRYKMFENIDDSILKDIAIKNGDIHIIWEK
jgi:hypothetical protein